MFFIVCASTSNSSVRVGCPGAAEAVAKVQELEQTGVGKVRIFDDVGKRFSLEELQQLAASNGNSAAWIAEGGAYSGSRTKSAGQEDDPDGAARED